VTAGGLVIAIGADEFVFAGTGMTVTFESDAGDQIAGILSAQEGKYKSGRWLPGRWLNGDQTHQGRHLRLVHSASSGSSFTVTVEIFRQSVCS